MARELRRDGEKCKDQGVKKRWREMLVQGVEKKWIEILRPGS